MRRRTALFVVITSAACFATLAVLTRLAYAEGGRPLPLLSWRFAIAGVLMIGLLAVRRPGALRDGLKDLPRYAALSFTGYGAASVCFFFSLQHITASVATVLLYAYPAIVALIESALDRERIAPSRLGAIVMTFLGCALAAGVLDGAVEVNGTGIVLALGAALGYALFTVLSDRLVGDRSRLVLMAYTFALSAVGVGLVTVVVGEPLSPAGWTPRLWLILALIVLVPTYAAVTLFLRGVRELGASQASLVSAMEPVFTVVLAILLLGERLTIAQSAGAALVIGGIALAERPRKTPDVPAGL
ncbi:MAG: DMT family transporter [Coriobacteriia bacterium]|nr:DMT family transporter [Coriobacteriia bacterium]